MNRPFISHCREFSLALAAILFLGPVIAPMAVPALLPGTEAASSRDKRKLRKFKKKNRRLKKRIRLYASLLAIAQRPVPLPAPFVEMVKVSDIENGADPTTYGAVPYEYSIGKYEVSLAQYAAFLNAVAAADTYDLYHPSMETTVIAGIARSGTSGSFTYAVIRSGRRPVTYVSWFDAARFCNWLHNGRPTGAQDAGTTERGAYTLDGATSGVGFSVNCGAKFWIPTEDEWYKAAYHQPDSSGGPTDDYWLYPTASDAVPGNDIGPTANQANFFDGNYSVTGEPSVDPTLNHLTDGGAYGGSASFYGTFDQGGNVWEWNDAVLGGTDRGARGGSWGNIEDLMRSSSRTGSAPDDETSAVGFRIASP